MVRTIQCSTELTVAEINDLKRITKTNSTKEALQEAVEYRIMHANEKKVE